MATIQYALFLNADSSHLVIASPAGRALIIPLVQVGARLVGNTLTILDGNKFSLEGDIFEAFPGLVGGTAADRFADLVNNYFV